MTDILLTFFIISLIYLSIANRLMAYVGNLVFQGLLICGIAILSLEHLTILNLSMILLETLVVKAILMPFFIRRVIISNKITRETEPSVPYYVSLIMTTVFIIGSYLIATSIESTTLNKSYFVAALSGLLSGLYLIATRRKVITHVICYVVIENGAFVLSLGIGSEMPVLVNLGVLLDVLVSVFLLGIFINKVGDVTGDGDIQHLNMLNDYPQTETEK
ncbi:MAG: hypothetical protein II951_09165 [Bacteroidales bacterium]|nr:hypothetical protein [Bacteroidales bacterium]